MRSICSPKYTSNITDIKHLLFLASELTNSMETLYSLNLLNNKPKHLLSWLDNIKIFYYVIGIGVVGLFIFAQIDINKKIKKQFRYTFPTNKKFKL